MTSLVLDLQEMSQDTQTSVSKLVRKAHFISKKLNVDKLSSWLDKELSGYKNFADLPKYRFICTNLMDKNPYHGLVPLTIAHDEISSWFRSVPMYQSVVELEHLISRDGLLELPLHAEFLTVFINHGARNPCLTVDKSQIIGLLEGVRTAITQWSLDLEKQGILGEGLQFSEQEKTAATQTIHIAAIHGNVYQGIEKMSIFDQRNQKVNYQYNAAGNINFGAVQNRIELAAELEKLRMEISTAKSANVIDEETALDLDHKIGKAALQIKKPDAVKSNILEWLSGAKDVVKGVAAAGAISIGIQEAIQAAQKLF